MKSVRIFILKVLVFVFVISDKCSGGKKSRVYLFNSQEANLFDESPLYLSSASSVPEVNTFVPFAECAIGLWTFYSENKFSGTYKGYSPYDHVRCASFPGGIASARVHGNLSDITQPSVTFYEQDEFLGEPTGPFFRHVPEFEGNVTSLVLTGTQSAVRLFTKTYYGGLEYCLEAPTVRGLVGAVFDNIPHRTGLNPAIIKSFLLAPTCFERFPDPALV